MTKCNEIVIGLQQQMVEMEERLAQTISILSEENSKLKKYFFDSNGEDEKYLQHESEYEEEDEYEDSYVDEVDDTTVPRSLRRKNPKKGKKKKLRARKSKRKRNNMPKKKSQKPKGTILTSANFD